MIPDEKDFIDQTLTRGVDKQKAGMVEKFRRRAAVAAKTGVPAAAQSGERHSDVLQLPTPWTSAGGIGVGCSPQWEAGWHPDGQLQQ